MTNTLAGTTCMELALEGERLCKAGDLTSGIRFFEEAIKVGTNDHRTLSAIYSQLGNAFFYLEEYKKALEFHKLDVELVRTIGDQEAEAKACGNLGNTLKMLDRFDEAVNYCCRSQEISRSLNDLEGQGRALYNLGNVFHTKGKRMIGASDQEPGDLSLDIRQCLEEAIKYYEENLEIVSQLNDYSSMGRAYGNLGNTHYLLGNFEKAVENHTRRLELAIKTGEKLAERRAHLNLGNANVFLGNFQHAVENYSATLKIAQELQDKYTEAHSCYSLANTYTFLRDYQSAIKYHLLYLETIKDLDDKLGEGRACWSLVNIYQMVNDPDSALRFAKRHYKIAEQLNDKIGQESARLNIEELNAIIEQKQAAQHVAQSNANSIGAVGATSGSSSSAQSPTCKHIKKHNADGMYTQRLTPDKRQDQEQRRFKRQLNKDLDTNLTARTNSAANNKPRMPRSGSSEKLFDMIAHFQSGRIDDQRCEMFSRTTPSLTATQPKTTFSNTDRVIGANGAEFGKENLHDELQQEANVEQQQNRYKQKQRLASAESSSSSQSSNVIQNSLNSVSNSAVSMLKATYRKASLVAYPSSNSNSLYHSQRRPTSVSTEHRDQLFELIAGVQGQRMDEQRAALPSTTRRYEQNQLKPSKQQASIVSVTQSSTLQTSKPQTDPPPPPLPPTKHSNLAPLTKNQHCNQRTTNPARSERIFSTGNAMISNSFSPAQREKSHSIAPQTLDAFPKQSQIGNTNSMVKRQIANVLLEKGRPVRDENFLDSLMKYQSTRFDDQRSEFPSGNKARNSSSVNNIKKNGVADKDDFLNLIVKFQSERIDDQRSAPPPRQQQAKLMHQASHH